MTAMLSERPLTEAEDPFALDVRPGAGSPMG